MEHHTFKIDLPLFHHGKVRDLYILDDNHLLMVASDRISAFDVILPDQIPGKGEILTQLSRFWFTLTRHLVSNHLTHREVSSISQLPVATRRMLHRRSIIIRAVKPFPFEAIVRGYLAGSGWKDYQNRRMICDITLPGGMLHAQKLTEPIFTPSTKAHAGGRDVNISFQTMCNALGEELARQIRDHAVEIYQFAANYALQRGVIIADTKFEFGISDDGQLLLIDEVLTPDSSRFWGLEQYRSGTNPPSFDKQFIRSYLESLGWNKIPPAPRLPREIIHQTTHKYQQAQNMLTHVPTE